MTAPKHSPLVEVATDAVIAEMKRQNLASDKDVARTVYRLLVGVEGIAEARLIAKAAIAACHAEEIQEALRNLVALNDNGDVHELGGGCECCGSWSESTPQFTNAIEQARVLLAKLDGKP